mmetsp:Transcript_81788/g.243952  ORF Transcript_81788/g.243952 Transcript_81788/m.243952 type:complete len:202 (+) Transcript_81788:204-809(+)
MLPPAAPGQALRIGVDTDSMPLAADPLALVSAPVWPGERALALLSIPHVLPDKGSAIRPGHRGSAVKLPLFELPGVAPTVVPAEHTLAVLAVSLKLPGVRRRRALQGARPVLPAADTVARVGQLLDSAAAGVLHARPRRVSRGLKLGVRAPRRTHGLGARRPGRLVDLIEARRFLLRRPVALDGLEPVSHGRHQGWSPWAL